MGKHWALMAAGALSALSWFAVLTLWGWVGVLVVLCVGILLAAALARAVDA